ncbi:MAG: hypothetical protein L6V81_03395 [Clostridium sp.]|nr:MAG: hypothetical protein L6V81_03395 [Clostridium sp.]
MITGSRYWTMTAFNNGAYIVDIRKLNTTSTLGSFESRITELVIPETMVTGTGSRNNPWMFVIPEFKIAINLVNANISGKKMRLVKQ